MVEPTPLLSVRDLRVTFDSDGGRASAVDGVSFDVAAGETVGVVGESGSGKSATALALLRLIRPPGRIEPGSAVLFEGRDLLRMPEGEIRELRGSRIAMVFQEPLTALNPVYTVGTQIAEVLRVHGGASRRASWSRAVEMLDAVGVAAPHDRARQYPHQLSGGTRQRVMMAIALVLHPALLIADEPTSSLDVTIQAQILALLMELRERLGMSVLLISHDLGVIAEIASRVIVMYAGQVIEEAPVDDLFGSPHHPYTAGLLRAAPRLDAQAGRVERLAVIPGVVPPATAWPAGCRFHDRCPFAWERCVAEAPPLYAIEGGHRSRCHLAQEPARRQASPARDLVTPI
jgi:peptide/nickel transport system ATP-binding protein